MFQSMRKRLLVIVACLCCGSVVSPTAQAGQIIPSQIEGDYAVDILESPPSPPYPTSYSPPWVLSLEQGEVTSPTTLAPPNASFSADDLSVTISDPTSVTLSSTFTLTGTIAGVTETIQYNITPGSGRVYDPNTIIAGLSLAAGYPTTSPVTIPPPVSVAKLNPATLLLIFPPYNDNEKTGVDFDPHWAPPAAPVIFEILQTPEPASIVYLSWGGVLGLISSWKRLRRRAGAASA